jgi:soluble lytic murein transglycosylase-like protein
LGYSPSVISDLEKGKTTLDELVVRQKLEMLGHNKNEIEARIARIFHRKIPVQVSQAMVKHRKLSSKELMYHPIIRKASSQLMVDEALIFAVIRTESSFNKEAVSSKNAKGLMQLIDATAEMMKVGDVFDPHQNIMGGAKYLRYLSNRFGGDLDLILASYIAGPELVASAKGVPNIKVVKDYVTKVKLLYSLYQDKLKYEERG